jgi:acetolactate synthase I/II/III large subunit
MGFALPGAIAAKLARPEAPVVCLLGDGCFQMMFDQARQHAKTPVK